MNKEKVFAWIESLKDMADQSDRYFVERTELYRENQEKDKEIERLNNIINRMEIDLKEMYMTFGEFNEEYTEKKIRELKEEINKLKENK